MNSKHTSKKPPTVSHSQSTTVRQTTKQEGRLTNYVCKYRSGADSTAGMEAKKLTDLYHDNNDEAEASPR